MPNSYRRSQFAIGPPVLSIAGFFLPKHPAAQSGAVGPRAEVTVINTGLIKPALAKSQNGPVQAEE